MSIHLGVSADGQAEINCTANPFLEDKSKEQMQRRPPRFSNFYVKVAVVWLVVIGALTVLHFIFGKTMNTSIFEVLAKIVLSLPAVLLLLRLAAAFYIPFS